MPETPQGLAVRVTHLEGEVEKLRDRAHSASGQIAALRTLAEVAQEQRSELIKDVAGLGADLRAGFNSRDTTWDRAFRDQRDSLRSTLRWAVGIALTGGIGAGALIVQVLHG
jgi:hypothetical protein